MIGGRKILSFGDKFFLFLSFAVILFSFCFILAVVVDIFADGLKRLSPEFFTSFPSRRPERAGILSAWVGTLSLMAVALPFSLLFGVLAGIYLEEYAPRNFLTRLIEVNINNLAAVPSVIYGLLALGIFGQLLGFGESVITGGLALGTLMLPIIIVTTREAIRSVPQTIREASYAVGSTKFETIFSHVIPYCIDSIVTGVIIALTRAIGETAPLVVVGAVAFIAFLPPSPIQTSPPFISFEWLSSPFTALPVQMFNWVSRPQKEFHHNAAAVGTVLIFITAILIMTASFIRWRFGRRVKFF